MYCLQIESACRLFNTRKQMMDFFKAMAEVQRMCCTLFDYSKKKYAEGKDFCFGKKIIWRPMP